MRWTGVTILTTFVAISGAACDAVSPSTVGAKFAGTWSGEVQSSVAGNGTMHLRLDERLVGTWELTFASEERRGSLGGAFSGSEVSLFLTPVAPTVCSMGVTLSGTMALTGRATDGHIEGTYVRFTCTGAESGRVDLTRRGD